MATNGADSTWSWVIAAACCWVTFVIQGLVRSGGVVYVALIDAYGVTRAQASWPFTLRMAIWNLSGPLAGALSYRWSIRSITFCGVLIITLTNVACWLVGDIYLITFFLGGLQGLGVGLAVTLVPVMINQYFIKYKSTGAGIAAAGATAGSFALPTIVEFAIEEYGLGGSFLMMAGITLHGILGAALMRPASWLKKKNALQTKRSDQNLNFLSTKSKNVPEIEEVKTLLSRTCTSDSKSSKSVRFSCEEVQKTTEEESCLITDGKDIKVLQRNENSPTARKAEDKISENDAETSHCNKETPQIPQEDLINSDCDDDAQYGQLQLMDNKSYDPHINFQTVYMPLNATEPKPILKPGGKEAEVRPRWRCLSGITEPLKAACEVVKNPMFLIIASNYSIFFLSYMTYLIVIVDYSLDLGVDRTDCVFLVSAFSIADLAGRLGSGWITDSGIVKRKHLMMVNMVTFGVLLIATSFATTYMAVSAVSVSAGLVVGINLILFYALLEEYLGLSKLPMAIGLMNFSIGVVSLVTPLLTGYFRDTMGSYNHLFHLLGGMTIFCGLLWVLEPLSAACDRKNAKKNISLEC